MDTFKDMLLRIHVRMNATHNSDVHGMYHHYSSLMGLIVANSYEHTVPEASFENIRSPVP